MGSKAQIFLLEEKDDLKRFLHDHFVTIFSGGLSGRVGMSKRLSASLFLCRDVFSHHSTYCEAGWSCRAGTSSSHAEAIKQSVGVLAECTGTKQGIN